MKTLHCTSYFLTLFVCVLFISSASQANWQRSESDLNAQQIQQSPNTHTADSNSDSLPAGVTHDWLNTLTDERGNRIIPEEEPETDALQQNTFDGSAIGVNYAKSVSSAGDVNGDGFDDVIIGDPNGNNGGGTNSGRAYIYFGGTIINSTADVILGGETVNNYFGNSVSSAGDVNSDGYDDVIVGANGFNSFTGRAYIYYGGAIMNSAADVIMTGEFTGHNFGSSVSGAGDVNADGYSDVIVGAYAASVYTGKAYIYFGGSSMNNIADVNMAGENSNDNFGYSVSGAGDVNGDGYQDVICGAYGYNSDFGRAYIYFGSVTMDNVADVSMYGGAFLDYFGASVSNAGDVNDDGYSDVIVGAYGYNSLTGRAYIFYGGASMNSIPDVTMTGETTNNVFGYSVSEAGDVNGDGFADVYVGAYGYSSAKGRAYLYYGGTNMNNAVDIFMTGEDTFSYFGYSVSGGGDVNGDGFADLIAGAYGFNSNIGRAYVFTNTMTGEDIPDVTMTGGSNKTFGASVSNAGDVNHDGFNDVIVGEPGINGAYIFYGGEIVNNVADVILSGVSIDTSFGASVSTAGDINGDGYSDVIICSYKGGSAKIYFGGSNMNNVPDVLMTNDNGRIVSDAGDVNGDGYSDVMVARPENSNWRGTVNIYYGGTNMDNVPDIILTGEAENDLFGTSISSAGDVNGDGYSDVIVGSWRQGNITSKVYIFYGGVSMNTVPDFLTVYRNQGGLYGAIDVSNAGDVNGDGYSDVIVGKPDFNDFKGRVFLYHGGYTMDTIADLSFAGDLGNDNLGWSLSSAGDVNEDGYSDIIVSARINDINFPGKCSVYFGSSNMDSLPDIVMNGENNNDGFGEEVSSGDFNGDGYSDVIVGAYKFDQFRGKAYIYLSSPPDNRKNLFLFGAIQGMYDPVLDTEVPDTIKVYLRNSTSPFARVDSSKNILLGPGTGQQFLFRNVQNGIPYYIEVTHRNALTTWSADPVTFVNSDASIAFSVNSIYAYGNNEIQVDNSPYDVFAFYSGDVNQDGTIDASDLALIDNDASNFVGGYVVTDLTGDDFVDGTDFALADNNAANFVGAITP
ncbi:MAG: FG-GAP repeat protein [Ignavibacteria bacterium]|nr:FG-GAP repeat protein [Ignavibacteria bacterium]